MEVQMMITKTIQMKWRHAWLFAAALAAGVTLALCGLRSTSVHAAGKPAVTVGAGWDRAAAARYLDDREIYWQGWEHAKKDHGTMCVSCHTQATYGLARPALRSPLGESGPTQAEQVMLASIEKRVSLWNEMAPFYSDATSGAGKEVESRNAESVLNSIILSSYDQSSGHLSPTTRAAFDHAWALQSASGATAGAWVWQNFHYTPWESPESEYHGAALMAIAVARAPDHYRDDPKIAANLAALTGYLSSHYEAQPLLNKVVALWASNFFPGLLTPAQRNRLLDDLYARQRAEGGWSLTDLGTWKRVDDTALETRPDGYATGLTVLVLEQTTAREPHLKARAQTPIALGVAWLKANQDKTTGAWPAWSLNKKRDPDSNVGKFMSDAATSYAVLALEEGN
jgi:squalene-hopene/tetraprenyl-beta-curcumene cyclase